jgi:hypothetical protein
MVLHDFSQLLGNCSEIAQKRAKMPRNCSENFFDKFPRGVPPVFPGPAVGQRRHHPQDLPVSGGSSQETETVVGSKGVSVAKKSRTRSRGLASDHKYLRICDLCKELASHFKVDRPVAVVHSF